MFILIDSESKLDKEREEDMEVTESEAQWGEWTGGPSVVSVAKMQAQSNRNEKTEGQRGECLKQIFQSSAVKEEKAFEEGM